MEELWFRIKFYLMRLAYLKKRSRLRRYGLPLVLVSLSLLLIYFLPEDSFQIINSQTLSLLLLFFFVTVSSWYGGLGPGILATILTASLNYFTLLQEDGLYHSQTNDLAISFLYVTIGVLISVISEARYEAELQKDEFVAMITHELKNPLSAVRGYAELAKSHSGGLKNQKLRNFIEEIGRQNDRVLELINDLLDVNRIEIGKFTYRDELFNFDDLVKEIVTHQRVMNPNRQIFFSGRTKRIIKADRYRIGQVISNLVTNAIKYSFAPKPVKVKIQANGKTVILSVEDFGPGIPLAEQAKIFNQHYRARRMLIGRTEGLGLGLFISKSIINEHGGTIQVRSDGKKGSIFVFSLPLRKKSFNL